MVNYASNSCNNNIDNDDDDDEYGFFYDFNDDALNFSQIKKTLYHNKKEKKYVIQPKNVYKNQRHNKDKGEEDDDDDDDTCKMSLFNNIILGITFTIAVLILCLPSIFFQ